MHSILVFLFVVAASFLAVFVLASYLKFETLTEAKSAESLAVSPRARLVLHLVKRLGPGWGAKDPLTLLLWEEPPPPPGAGARPESPLASVLRPRLRTTDDWLPAGEFRHAAVLPIPSSRSGAALSRLYQAAAGALRPEDLAEIRLGIAGFPDDAREAAGLLAGAERTLARPGPGSPWAPAPAPAPEGEGEEPGDPRLVDGLTGALRPDRLGIAARRFLGRLRAHNLPASVLHLDIERFHEINDRMGREAGDAALRHLGRLVAGGVRETDLIGRLGGDDLVVLLDAPPEAAERVGARLTEAVRLAPLSSGGRAVRISLNLGCAGYPEFQGSYAELFEAAALAMQAARRTGGNLCVRYRPEMRRAARPPGPVEDRF